VLVTDGPFAETKEFIAGFDLVECADLEEAIEVAAAGPVSWYMTIEIRPFTDGPWLGERTCALGRGLGRHGRAQPRRFPCAANRKGEETGGTQGLSGIQRGRWRPPDRRVRTTFILNLARL
jgi:YCII-related domain